LPSEREVVIVTTSTVEHVDYVIVGAGPAGLQMGYHLGAAGRSYVILEAGPHPGTFFDTFPRHRRLLSINKRFNYFSEAEFNLRHDWNSLLSDGSGPLFTAYSEELFPDAAELVRYLQDYATRFDINVRCGRRVCQISPLPESGFVVTDDKEQVYRCKRLLLGTGARGPLIPDIEGIELARGYEDHPLELAPYQGKRVAIIGQGNSAFEVANHIAGHAAIVHLLVTRPPRHAWKTHFPGDLRAINNTILDMYQLKSLHSTVGLRAKAIRRRSPDGFEVFTETEYPHWNPPRLNTATLDYDEVIRCTGFRYTEASLFPEGCAPAVDANAKFYTLDSTWQTTVPDLYCIGTTMQARDRRAATPFIHGFRYNVRTLFHLLEEMHYGADLPGERFRLRSQTDIEEVAAFLVKRLSITSALYQQFGTLCDVLLLRDGHVRVYQELPVDYVHERGGMGDAENLVVMTLEYGFDHYPSRDPLEFILPVDVSKPPAFLHPVLRHYRRGELAEELHLRANLIARYDFSIFRGRRFEENGHQNRLGNLLGRITGIGSSSRREDVFSLS
jgi:thioredoxin reductase